MSRIEFKTAEVEDVDNVYSPLPEGVYQGVIVASEVKPTRANTGMILSAQIEILGPTHQGRRIFLNENLQNDNPTAQKIGRARIKALCLACGFTEVEDTCQLHNIPMQLRIGIDKKDAERNVIKDFAPYVSQIQRVDAALAKIPEQKQQQPTAPNSPWAKK